MGVEACASSTTGPARSWATQSHSCGRERPAQTKEGRHYRVHLGCPSERSRFLSGRGTLPIATAMIEGTIESQSLPCASSRKIEANLSRVRPELLLVANPRSLGAFTPLAEWPLRQRSDRNHRALDRSNIILSQGDLADKVSWVNRYPEETSRRLDCGQTKSDICLTSNVTARPDQLRISIVFDALCRVSTFFDRTRRVRTLPPK